MGKREITKEVASFIENMTYEEIPQETVEKAKYFVMDYLGVTAGGSNEPAGKILRQLAPLPKEGLEASIIGSAQSTTPDWAALTNGTAGHALDFDDVNEPMYGHPSVPVLPAVFAVAETLGLGGAALLLSYVVGLELAAKLPHAMNPGHYQHGWHSTATMGSVGAAAAASKLYDLKGEQLKSALALGCTQAFGLQQNFGTMTKPFHAGKASQNGVIAAMLASKGWTGDQNIFEAPIGYFHVFCASGDYDPDQFVERLGKPFVIDDTGLIIKKHPSCAFSHPAVDAALEILDNPAFDHSQIERIEGQILPINDQVLLHRNPKTGLEAKFSLEGLVAMAFIDGKLIPRSFADSSVQRDEVQGLIGKVERRVMESPKTKAQDFGPSSVRVFLRDGKVLEATVKDARGTPKNPMTQAEIEEKYRDCCSGMMTEANIKKSLNLIKELDKLETLDNLMACYQPAKD